MIVQFGGWRNDATPARISDHEGRQWIVEDITGALGPSEPPQQRSALTISGIVQIVLAVGESAGLPGLRPHRCRHTYATRLRQGGADPAQVQALLGLASVETAARYFRAGQTEQAEVVERVFE